MSDETGRDDRVLGTALARAIDSQGVRATPFERSRVAVRMAGGGRSPLVPVLAAAAAILLGLALGAALLGQRGTDPGGVASSPTPSPDGTQAPSTSPTPTEGTDPIWVYFALDQLPPVGAQVRGTFDDASAEIRIASRVFALWATRSVPTGATNVVSKVGGAVRDGGRIVDGAAVQVEGDLATLDFRAGAFESIRGAAETQAVLAQLVYTITEEPGIRRALIREAGQNATIDQLVIDKPLAREDVLPYEGVKTEEKVSLEDDPRPNTTTTRIEDITGGIRFVIEMKANETPAEGFWSPRLTAELRTNDDTALPPAKWALEISIGGATPASAQPRLPLPNPVDRSPLRSYTISPDAAGTRYTLRLDDARPWRLSLEPGAERGTMRLIVDIGGHPQAISESVAVYGPKPGDQVSRTFTLTGTARAFEAHVSWRIKDSSDREVATGFTTASLGTSPVWGTFTTEVKVPDSVSGVITLEVFWPSPRDGADVGRVSIPLRVR